MIIKEFLRKIVTSDERVVFYQNIDNYIDSFFFSVPRGTIVEVIVNQKEYEDGDILYEAEALMSVNEGDYWSYLFVIRHLTKIEIYDKSSFDAKEVLFDGSK